MKRYVIIALLILSSLFVFSPAQAYTREELESQLREEMKSAYDQSNKDKEQLSQIQNTLKDLEVQQTANLQALEEKVRSNQITDAEYKKQKKAIEKNYEKLKKDYEKQAEKLQDSIDKFNEDFEEKYAEIDKKMAEQDELGKEAEEKTNKLMDAIKECDAMAATTAKRQECIAKAQKKYELSEEEKEALDYRNAQLLEQQQQMIEDMEAAAEDEENARKISNKDFLDETFEEEGPEEEEITLEGEETIAGVDVVTEGDSDTLSGGDATNPGSFGSNGLAGCSGDVFEQITCKTLGFLSDLRLLAYIISGFGMIVFTFGAIFNKINWKHFSYIAIGLFLLSVMGSFIEYFTGDSTAAEKLGYGNHMTGGYTAINGSSNGGSIVTSGDIPNVNVENTSESPSIVTGGGTSGGSGGSSSGSGGKWTFKDIGNAIKSGINAGRDAYNTFKTAQGGWENIKNTVSDITNAIKNNEGGLRGLIDTATSIAGSVTSGTYEAKNDLNNILNRTGSAANNLQDMFSNPNERQDNQDRRDKGETTNMVTDWLAGGGEGAKDTAGAINQGATDVGKGVGNVANTANEGQMIGGDTVGGIMGAGQAIVEMSGAGK